MALTDEQVAAGERLGDALGRVRAAVDGEDWGQALYDLDRFSEVLADTITLEEGLLDADE